MVGEKVVLMLIVLGTESTGSAGTLMAVLISVVSTTAFYRGPDDAQFEQYACQPQR